MRVLERRYGLGIYEGHHPMMTIIAIRFVGVDHGTSVRVILEDWL